MKVTANVLLNYIKCRRYASLNDPNSDFLSDDGVISNNKYLKEYLKIFKEVYIDDFEFIDESLNLSYEFHSDITLFDNFHFIVKNNKIKEIYILVPLTSTELLKLKYKCVQKNYQMFRNDKKGYYKINNHSCNEFTGNYLDKINKLTNRTNNLGRIIYTYAFKKYLYDSVTKTIKKSKIYFVMLNSNYIYDGVKYTKSLFDIFDFSYLYKKLKTIIEADIYRMINHIELNDFTPCKLVKNECRKDDSYECKFIDFCFNHLPKENSIFSYFHSKIGFTEKTTKGDIHHDTYDLINSGMVDMLDVPISWLKDEKHLMQRYCVDNNTIYVNKKKIETILKTLKYPLIYLDFEALPSMLPRYYGEGPFTQSVFQYSIHIELVEGKLKLDDLNHFEFISNFEYDDRLELVKSMINLINQYDSTVIVYHKTFEEQRLKEMQVVFPEFKKDLQNIIDRLFDLKDVVKNNKRFYLNNGFSEYEARRYNFYAPILNGSYSLKKVIKVFNEKAYDNLVINNGINAYKAYMNLNKLEQTEKEKMIYHLLEYCKQDTYSMFEIIDGLKKYLSRDFKII